MATRRSRLSIKPNLGPKLGAAKPGPTKPKAATLDKNVKQLTEPAAPVPKKETLERLRKKVNEDDTEKELDKEVSVANDGSAGQAVAQPVNNGIGNSKTDTRTETQSLEITSSVQKEQSITSEEAKDTHDVVMAGSQDQNKAGAVANGGKDGGSATPVMPKLPVSPKNKVQMITRNRLPKARPNLADAGRPRKAADLTIKGGIHPSGPLSPMKSPRSIISQSPDKALSSPEKSVVVARELKVHYPTADVTDSSGQASKSDTRVSGPSGETTVAERRHRNLSGMDVPPIIERRQRQMSTSETVVGEKRHRHSSIAENSTPKRKKPAKIDAPTDIPVDRNKLKMGDLIYWNPSSNPMKKKAVQEKKKKKSVSPSDDDEEDAEVSLTAPAVEEEKLDDPEPMEDEEAMPVPQVKIGPDGNIIINEESLVIKNNDNIIEEDGDVIDETDSTVTYTSFRKQRQKLSWSEKETQKFYKALSYIGTDFSLMLSVFPKRTRNDIKKKFAIEDRRNRDKVEVALRNKKPFNMAAFEEDEDTDKEVTKPKRKSRKGAKKENKIVDKSTKKSRSEWKSYYKDKDDSEEVEAKKATQKRQQVEDARRRLLVTRNSSQRLPRGPEESNEIVEILMNMSKGNNPVPPVPDTPHVENVMVMQSGMPVVDIGTDTDQLVQLLQTSGQAALIGDNVNEPLILVYNRPTVPGGETVIHVYKIQPDSNGALNIPASLQQGGEQPPGSVPVTSGLDNTTSSIGVDLPHTSDSDNTGCTNVSMSDFSGHTRIQQQVDINFRTLPSSTETQQNLTSLQATSLIQNNPNQTEVISECVSSEHFDRNYSESVSLRGSIVQSREQLVTNVVVPETCRIRDTAGTEDPEDQRGVGDVLLHCPAEKTVVVRNEDQEKLTSVEPLSELSEQYIDDVTSVVPQPLEYT